MKPTDTRRLVDPQLLPLLDQFPALDLTLDLLPLIREPGRLQLPFEAPPEGTVAQTRRLAPGPEGAPEVGVAVFRPTAPASPRPCVLHIHGGGFVGGSVDGIAPMNGAFAHALDCVIVSVDYRLAPETPYPGAIEDCYAALAWSFAEADALGVDPTRIGVMGESAGAGLAAALALLARDRREYRLAFQNLVYPMLDDRTCVTPDPHPTAGEFIWTPHNNAFGWRALLGVEPGSAGVSPYAAPARALDLSGLPPTFISIGALDLFLEEDIDYARRLTRAGVPVDFRIYAGAFHAFDLAADAEVAANARADRLAALRAALHPGPARDSI